MRIWLLCKAQTYRVGHASDDGLGEGLLDGDHFGERAAWHEVHGHPQGGGRATHEECVAVVYNGLVVARLHDHDLVHKNVALGLLLHVHLLHGHQLAGARVLRARDMSIIKRTSSCTVMQ